MFLLHAAVLTWLIVKVRCQDCREDIVRLVGGRSEFEGRVEIFRDGSWGTVCDDFWGISDATVVCRQLGLFPAGSAIARAGFGQGSGPIVLDDVRCTGSEERLAECPATVRHDCTHIEDAGVRCRSGTLPTIDLQTNRTDTSVAVSWDATPAADAYNVTVTTAFSTRAGLKQTYIINTEVTGNSVMIEYGDLLPEQNYSVCVCYRKTAFSCTSIQTPPAHTTPSPSPPSPPLCPSLSCPSLSSSLCPMSIPSSPTPVLELTSVPPYTVSSLPTPTSTGKSASAATSPNCSLLGGVLGSIIALLVLLLIVAGVGLAYPRCIRSRTKNSNMNFISNISYTGRSQHSTNDGAGIYVTPSYEAVPDPPSGPRTGDTAEECYEMPQVTPGEPRHGPSISQVTADIVAQHYEMYEATHPEHSAEPAVYEVPVNKGGDSKQPAGDYSRLQYQ